LAALPLDEGEAAIGDRHVGPAADDAAIDLERLVDAPRGKGLDGAVHRCVDPDQALRIVLVGVAIFSRRLAGHVPERAQTRLGVSRLRTPLTCGERVELAQPGGERAIAFRRAPA